MSLDTPATEPNASLSVRDAAALFGGDEPEQETTATADATPAQTDAQTQAESDPNEQREAAAEPDAKVTIEVDGKTVELSKAELADHFKNGLRQADYTRKTMEAAEQRKAADAEATKAREERHQYAQGLQQAQAVLTSQLQERTPEQWNELAKVDPAEWVLQRNLYEQRHAAYSQNQQALQTLAQRSEAEAKHAKSVYVSEQREQLLAKLPDWKDPAKAQAEQGALAQYLQEQGFDADLIFNLADHRMVLVARDAMRYRDMVAKAKAVATKVQALPPKVERPGGGETHALDGRTSAMKQLSKSGSVRDAANVFDRIFK